MRKIDISRKIKLRIEFFLNRRNQRCLLISFFRLLTCFRRKFAIVTTNHERPKPVERERERERERRKKVDRLVSMVGVRVTNTGWKRWRRTMAEGAGTGESRIHRARTRPATPLPPTRAGLRFQHVQYRNRVVNSEDRNGPRGHARRSCFCGFCSFYVSLPPLEQIYSL